MRTPELPPHFHWELDRLGGRLWVQDTFTGRTVWFTEDTIVDSAIPIEYMIMEAFMFTPPEPVNIMAQELDPWDEEEGIE